MRCILWWFFTILHFASQGQQTLKLTEPLKQAYKDISSLRIKKGEQQLSLLKLRDPNNALVYYIENYVDFFTLFIQEDKTKYKQLLKNRDKRLQKIKAADSDSPYYLFCQAEIILQWATIKLKFDDKISAAGDVYEAYKLLERNKEKYPFFKENNKSLSIIHALADSVPGWVRKIMGIKGSVELGTLEISELANQALKSENLFKDEIVAIYSYILFYSNNKKEEAFGLFDRYHLDHTTNPLITFLKASLAHKTGRNDLALTILEQRPVGPDYIPFYYLDFMYGKFKLCKLDPDANIHILKFIDHFKGNHYIKEAYQKLAWYHIVINKDINSYRSNMKLCLSKGNALIDEDIQAVKEAKAGQIPNDILLRARLLYDGGYYTRSQNLLILQSEKFVQAIHDGEYYYRLARVTEALKNYHDAIDYYKLTIIKSDPGKYYACNAALQLGLIYEQQNKYTEAKKYFEKCLDLDPAGYSSSLHQKAKSGLDRIKKK
ncbi:MAG: tetratricopeptide repeat protein [Saprospiraceae bacterium]|nr:tetratricopeptide repeat protein [Saprospiraceae bacterium]